MVSWELTSEQESIQRMVHRFAKEQIRPLALLMDEAGKIDENLLSKAKELGLQGGPVPTEYGGGGLDAISSVIIAEELGWGCAGVSVTLLEDWVSVVPLLSAGTEEQKKKWLPRVTQEGKLIGVGITEPNAGCDVANISTSATKKGDYYVLNGTKQYITNAGLGEFYTVFATVDKSKGHKGLIALLVEKDTPGFSIGKIEHKMGICAATTGQLIFEDAMVPQENLLGKEGDGFKIIMKTLDYSRLYVPPAAIGLARAAFEEAVKYAQERVQFGKPIGVNQAISFRLADMAIKIQAARHLGWHAAWLLDQKKSFSAQSAMAKCYASDVAMWTTVEALQIFGGAGYMKEFPLEKWMRDAKIFQIFVGTNEVQRMVISRSLMPSL